MPVVIYLSELMQCKCYHKCIIVVTNRHFQAGCFFSSNTQHQVACTQGTNEGKQPSLSCSSFHYSLDYYGQVPQAILFFFFPAYFRASQCDQATRPQKFNLSTATLARLSQKTLIQFRMTLVELTEDGVKRRSGRGALPAEALVFSCRQPQ